MQATVTITIEVESKEEALELIDGWSIPDDVPKQVALVEMLETQEAQADGG